MLKNKTIFYKTDYEIELIRQSCILVGKTLAEVAKNIKPGVKTSTLDKIAEQFIKDSHATPSFKGYKGFPSSLCISVNEQVVHGIPNQYELKETDIISVDCGVFFNDYHGDSAYTFALKDTNALTLQLLKTTYQALYKGIEQAVVGKRIGDISFAIQQHTEHNNPYSVVRELTGHGIGKNLHEAPDLPNHGKRGQGIKLIKGLVLAIEPMINMGRKEIKCLQDNWTIVTIDKKPSAHFEHTIAIGSKKADILSTFQYIEQAVQQNPELCPVFV